VKNGATKERRFSLSALMAWLGDSSNGLNQKDFIVDFVYALVPSVFKKGNCSLIPVKWRLYGTLSHDHTWFGREAA